MYSHCVNFKFKHIYSYKIINTKILQYKDNLGLEKKLQAYINSSPIRVLTFDFESNLSIKFNDNIFDL